MGHSTSQAALTYLHTRDEHQRAIAEALSKLTSGELERRGPDRSDVSATKAPGCYVKIACRWACAPADLVIHRGARARLERATYC